jgi:hypothetical protein
MSSTSELLDVVREARALMGHPDNDFTWSSLAGTQAAMRELDDIITRLEHGRLPARPQLDVLFAATGPIQEVSLQSGWSQQFRDLARRYDDAAARAYRS